ncbi:MAG: 4Fe-4S dicluster domain-containing protein [Chloroflexi bacterium]|nr:4Fe-4S dicluster domain-containing protein [Chloroflexota bacterium]
MHRPASCRQSLPSSVDFAPLRPPSCRLRDYTVEQTQPTTVEAKLGLNVFAIDKRTHIVIHQERCDSLCTTRHCIFVCPAKLYSRDAEGKMHVNFEGCLECGTCFIACNHEALEWRYPEAGFGVQYRFG